MSKMVSRNQQQVGNLKRGQVLMVVAVSIVAIVAIIGLSLDVGMMFIENARLRRAVDAAALAAALQFREGYQFTDLDSSAKEFLKINGINDPNALVQVCMDSPGDPPSIHHNPDLCPASGQMARKLVRVVASGRAYLAFLPVIGIDSAPIAAEATSETASVDVVLVLDRSESMTWTATDPTISPYDPMRDPSICNFTANPDASYQGYCRPFDEVKKAAVSFVEQLYFPYDRVSVVTFDKNPTVVMEFSNNRTAILNSIKGLTVYMGEETGDSPPGINSIYSFTAPSPLPSRWYAPDTGYYWGLQCAQSDPDIIALNPGYYADAPSPAPCTTTNIGAGMFSAGVRFTVEPIRKNSLWVVIVLTDGVANAGYGEGGVYFCPDSTWNNTDIPPRCNDGNSTTRHVEGSTAYDAEDYAYDGADFVALSQNALIFTIGLGSKVTQLSTVDNTPLGELFLQYAAAVGNGAYSGATSAELKEVFRQIAQNIATRLEH
jgi:hypothetical protein